MEHDLEILANHVGKFLQSMEAGIKHSVNLDVHLSVHLRIFPGEKEYQFLDFMYLKPH